MGMSAADYLAQLKALLPPGVAWAVPSGGNLEAVLAAIAEELSLAEQRAGDLLAEADPRGAAEMLPEWERIAGLPDACNPITSTLSERRQTATARLAEVGDVSLAGWVTRAALLGHTVTVREFTPSRAGQMQSGDELAPETAVFLLEIEAPTVLTHPFEAGNAQAGDPLGSFDTDRLRCNLERVRQAHTRLQFNFTI